MIEHVPHDKASAASRDNYHYHPLDHPTGIAWRAYAFLGVSIAMESAGSITLRLAHENRTWMFVSYACYAVAFGLFPCVLQTVPLGVAYATWSGIGCVLTALASHLLFAEEFGASKCIAVLFVVTGVFGMFLC